MKTAVALCLCCAIVTLCAVPAAARDSRHGGRALMRALDEEEMIDPRLEIGEMPIPFTASQVDTYCLVWYDFEQMNWQGWTQVDNTAQVDAFFHVDDFSGLGGGVHGGLAPLEGTKSIWCGARDRDHQIPGCPGAYDYLCSWAAAPGYGNDWNQLLRSEPILFTSPLVVSYKIRCDAERGYDHLSLEIDYGDYIDKEVISFDGAVDTVVTHTFYLAVVGTKLRFHFVSDSQGSDEDGLWDGDGAAIIDSITISHAGGIVLDCEDFESSAVGDREFDYWQADVESPFGRYSGLASDLGGDRDPCNVNFHTQIVFFIGSPYPSEKYPGLFDTPFCKGSGRVNPPCQDEMVVSPVIDLTKYSTGRDEVQDASIPSGELPDLGGVWLRFTVYEDLPLANLVFYLWHIRNIDPSGCPGNWLDRNYWYWSPGGEYVQHLEDIGNLVSSDSIQVALRCMDMCEVWYLNYGNCTHHTPSPWFDNVRLSRFNDTGPQWSYRDLDLFQDNFPGEEFNLESYIRADCANDLWPCCDPVIDPGDSIVVGCAAPRSGGIDTTPDGRPRVFMHVRCGYIGDPASPKPALFGPSLAGNYGTYFGDDGSEWTVIQAGYARCGSGNIAPDKYMFDLNDSLFTRGYRIDYYFEACDLAGESSTLPARIADPTHPIDETYFEWTCLPTLASDILYVDDYNRGAWPKGISQYYYDWSFFKALESDNRPDRYDVQSPSSLVSNGPGSRAKNYQLTTAYRTIIWDSGNLDMGTITEGTSYSDKSNDAQMLVDWMEFSEHDVNLWVCGDGIAYDLHGSGMPVAIELLNSYCGVVYAGDSYYALSGIINPQVEAASNIGNPLWHATYGDSFYALGGCPVINEFDYLEKTGNGEYALTYPDFGGSPRYAGIYNVGTNDGGYDIKTMWFGFSFMYIRDIELAPPIIRNRVMADVLSWMQNDLNPIPQPAGEDEMPLVTAICQNYPNPFNPVTTMKFSLKEKGHAKLKVYDVAGRLVKTLVDGQRKAGHYEERWDGTNNRGSRVASGVYFYRFAAPGFERTKKMVLLR